MRLRSEYHFTCAACDQAIVTPTTEGACPNCRTLYRLEWQAPYQPKPDPNRAPKQEITAHD